MTTVDDLMLADLRAQAEGMAGAEALPRADDGEPIFDEPWQGRAMAVAIETVAKLGVSWEEFRSRLIGAIDTDPHRNYYESWLIALEGLVAHNDLASAEQIATEQLVAAGYRTTEQEHDDLEVFPIAADENTLLDVLTELFEKGWESIQFGLLIQGAAFELEATSQPRLSMLDGYLTVSLGGADQGGSHFHLCIGEHHGDPGRPVTPELARRRRCAHAELQRQWTNGAPRCWMFRMFNGDGDQQLTVLLPNPFLSDQSQLLPEPDWSRLELWDSLREQYLSLPPDPADRLGTEFVHG
ncbi:MAG: nitrile hydratase subunit beta [Actinomycetia bacterium]|nr:nitrile hydratase subunit beta [Actinomycetes bacterium]